MSAGDTNEQDKRALYWLGERLIDYRHPIMIIVLAVTAVFAYWAFQLKLETSFGDLLPQTHPFVQIHNKYAGTFGGANNVQLMVEVKDGDIFTVPTLARIYKITEAVDQVYGVNHNQIDSIGHRTTRYLRAQSGGFLRAEPVMIGLPKTPEDAASIKRIVHNTESVYGLLVSLDDKAALVRANFIEGRLDHRRTFTEFNERVIAPFEKGWFGALIKGKDPLKPVSEAIKAAKKNLPKKQGGKKAAPVAHPESLKFVSEQLDILARDEQIAEAVKSFSTELQKAIAEDKDTQATLKALEGQIKEFKQRTATEATTQSEDATSTTPA